MTGKLPRSVRLWLALLAAGGSAAVSRAQEKEAPREGLREAQKEFEAIKAARDPALQLKADLPRVSAPEWHGTTPAPSGTAGGQTRAATKKLPGETKSKNWLVDAMQKPNPPRDGREPRGAADERETERDALAGTRDFQTERSDPHDELARSEEPAKKKENPPIAPEKVVNPLTTFLGDWMTPQDYALLKPGLSAPAANIGLANAPGASLSPVSSALTGPGSNLSAGPGSLSAPAAVLPTPRENPFLQTIAVVPPSTLMPMPTIVRPPASVPSGGLPQVNVPTPAPVPPPAKTPEFARPGADDKYFKQLKRF